MKNNNLGIAVELNSYREYEKYINKFYPHQSINDIKIGYHAYLEQKVKDAKSETRYAVQQQIYIREGYHKRMVELIDLIQRMLDDPDNNIKPIYADKFREATWKL